MLLKTRISRFDFSFRSKTIVAAFFFFTYKCVESDTYSREAGEKGRTKVAGAVLASPAFFFLVFLKVF